MSNKIAIVTGGSRGLGKEMALSLAENGIDVVLTYHSNEKSAAEVVSAIEANGRKAAALPFDASDTKSLDSFIENLAGLLRTHWNTDKFDFLINNAGIGATIPMAETTEEVFDNFTNIHYKSVYFLTQKLLPKMNEQGGVIFISSGTTRFTIPGYSVYSSLKGAIEVLSHYVAKEYAAKGIRSNVIAPGPVQTDFNEGANRDNEQRVAFLSKLTALGRVGRVDDIGGVVAFLCSDAAKWINGQRIEVSGGINL